MENSQPKKSKAGLFIIIGIVVALFFLLCIVGIIIVVSIVVGGNISYKTNSNTKTVVENNIKLDGTKDWVYDAEYEKNVSVNSYLSVNGNTYKVENIVFPYININSADSSNANSDIKNLFEKAISNYNAGYGISGDNGTHGCGVVSNYEYYLNGNVVSVNIKTDYSCTMHSPYEYHTYNFDTKTGNNVSYEDSYKKAGFTSETIETKILELIEKSFKDNYSSYSGSLTSFINESKNNYKESVNSNSIMYFFDDNNQLNVIVKFSIPAGVGYEFYIINVNKGEIVFEVANTNNNVDTNNEPNVDNTNTTDTTINKSIKKDVNAEYVTETIGETSSHKIPSININSDYANECNEAIKSFYESFKKMYTDNGRGASNYKFGYKYYIYENVLSLVVSHSTEDTAEVPTKVYNIDINTGERLSLNGVLSPVSKNLDEEVFFTKAEEAYTFSDKSTGYNETDQTIINQNILKIRSKDIIGVYVNEGVPYLVFDIKTSAGAGHGEIILNTISRKFVKIQKEILGD